MRPLVLIDLTDLQRGAIRIRLLVLMAETAQNQEQIAHAAGVSVDVIKQLCGGRCAASDDTFRAILAAFPALGVGLPVEYRNC